MTREIGEIFEYAGAKLKVSAARDISCAGCYLFSMFITNCDISITGECEPHKTFDSIHRVFKEVK